MNDQTLSDAEITTSDDDFAPYPTYYDDWQESHDYFGGHGGLGVEFRVARHIGIHVDGLVLVRKQIDDRPPEFVDYETGNTTDISGAGMLRAGVNFWW